MEPGPEPAPVMAAPRRPLVHLRFAPAYRPIDPPPPTPEQLPPERMPSPAPDPYAAAGPRARGDTAERDSASRCRNDPRPRPRLGADADGVEFADSADAVDAGAAAAQSPRRGAVSGGASVVSGWDSVGTPVTPFRSAIPFRRFFRTAAAGAAAHDGERVSASEPEAAGSLSPHSESRGRNRSRSRSRSRSPASRGGDTELTHDVEREPAAPIRWEQTIAPAAAAVALESFRSAAEVVRSMIGRSDRRSGGADHSGARGDCGTSDSAESGGDESGSENGASGESEADADAGGGEGEGVGEGEGESESESEAESADDNEAEGEGEDDSDVEGDEPDASPATETKGKAEIKPKAAAEAGAEAGAEADGDGGDQSAGPSGSEDEGAGDGDRAADADGEREDEGQSADDSESETNPRDGDTGPRDTHSNAPKPQPEAASAGGGDSASDAQAVSPKFKPKFKPKNFKTKPRATGGPPNAVLLSAVAVALALVLAGVAIHRARLRAGRAYGFQRWSGGPVFSAFPRSFGEAIARVKDGVTTPLGLTAGYIPGCVVQTKRCHGGGAYGLARRRAVTGFLERQSALGVVSNSTATATLETCADAARVWHLRCGNTARERVYTRFVAANGTHTLCVYPPRGVGFDLLKYLDAAGVCATQTECGRVAECFAAKGWGGERWTRERISNAELSACLPAFGQRLSWFTAGRSGAFQHPTQWRQRVDCERLPHYTLAREAEVERRIARDSQPDTTGAPESA